MSTIITDSVLSSRAMSSWPISIGTALAFETLRLGPNPVYDPQRPIPKGVDLSKIDSLWINLKTLYRNILGSLPSADQERAMSGELLYVLEQEVEIIREIVSDITNRQIAPTFYSNSYMDLKKIHPYATIKAPTTEKQLFYHTQENNVIMEFHKRHSDSEGVFHVKRSIIPSSPTRGLILTHSPYDILSSVYFSELQLLESHTGAIKNKSLFYTKFLTAKDQAGIPFNVMTLQVFGDSVLFAPMPIADRKELIAVAQERKWTNLTTKERIRLSLQLMENKDLAKKLMSMLNEDI